MFRSASVLLLIVLATTSCGGAPGTAASNRDRAIAAWRDATQCFRAHGFPAPDPVIDDRGHAAFPGDLPRVPDDVIAACQEYLDKVPDDGADAGISAADIERRRQFASCMRQHGVPMWPDPDAEGRFPNTPALEAEGKSPALVAARDTCQHFLGGGS